METKISTISTTQDTVADLHWAMCHACLELSSKGEQAEATRIACLHGELVRAWEWYQLEKGKNITVHPTSGV